MKEKFRLLGASVKLVFESSRGWTVLNSVMSLLRSVLPLALVWLLKLLVDAVAAAPGSAGVDDANRLVLLIAAVALVYFADEALADTAALIRRKHSFMLEKHMYSLLHEKAARLDLINFNRPEYHDCLTRASAEAPWRPGSILNNLVSLTRAGISVLLMAGLLSTLDWRLAVLLVAANVPGVWFRFHYSELLYGFHRKQTPEARKSAYYNWILTGDRPSRELRLFGLGRYFRDLFSKSFAKQKEEELQILRRRNRAEIVSSFFKAAALLVTILFIVRPAVRSEISIGEMAMFLLAFRQGMIFIREILASAGGLYEDTLYVADLFEFLELKEEVRAEEPVQHVVPLKKGLTAENLSFTYPGNAGKTIDSVSFEIKKGEIIALVGPNGAGKSTLVRLLCRLYDAGGGAIKYDGTDIRHMEPAEYRKMFSVIFQDFMLYNLSAGENIRLGDVEAEAGAADPASAGEQAAGKGQTAGKEQTATARQQAAVAAEATDRLAAAAAAAGAAEMINSLPGGFDTPIGNLFDESRELSWGEWQKLALARSLYRDAPVLILDEPSSSLDAATEHEVFSRFRDLVKGRTAILITHRFTNVSLADRIIVLDKGRIAESGTHTQLMRRGGLYSSMYRKQAERFTK